MKNFFTVFFSSLLGVIIATVLVGLIFVFSITGAIKDAFGGKDELPYFPKAKTVLLLDFSGQVRDRETNNPFRDFDFANDEKLSLDLILENLKKAKQDTSVKGLYLKMGNGDGGFATVEEIRNAVLDFKQAGKFVVAYGEVYGQKSYYLASAADKIFLNPQGNLDFKGLSAQIMFYKKALENLNVEVQVFRHGKYKSAVEPFFLDKMSENNRQQTEAFLNSIWASVTNGISKQRGISAEELNRMADNLEIQNAQDALNKKLVDGLKYDDEVQSFLKEKLGLNEKDKIAFAKMSNYKRALKKGIDLAKKEKGKIAIIYAIGQIESGEGSDEVIGSDRIAKAIRQARLDSSVKAIVLRVNSPGGSALASDVMWREVVLAKRAKPFVVSMGDVAASGGYYISCAADRIFAQPNTITGSIGVFGIMPNAQKLFREKLGIYIDTVNTNKHSDVGSLFRGVSAEEGAYIQKGVEDVYQVFISRVAEGRRITTAEVDSIGQGRVWSGTDAIKIKLVDELGGLDKAIQYAASKANMSEGEYSLTDLPAKKNPLEKLFGKVEEDMEARILSRRLGQQVEYVNHIKYLLNAKGVQARLPFDFIVY